MFGYHRLMASGTIVRSSQDCGQNMIRIIKKGTTCLGLGLSISTAALAEYPAFDMMALNEINLPDFNEYSVPVVLTATRLQQHQADVPASVTILDEHFIKQVSTQNIVELLRYVPGMMVGPDTQYNADSVQYHGGPAALPKNLQVLINGRSMYRSGLATVSWYEMPVAMEDIKRIEVVRGPNAASYGANAFQAIVNIITKHPADTYGSSVSIQGGNNGEENVYAKHGGRLGNSDYRISFTQKHTDNFEKDMDSKESRFMDFQHYYQNASLGEIESAFVLADSYRELESSIPEQTNQNHIKEKRIELGSSWTKDFSSKHQLKVKGYFILSKQDQKIEVENVPIIVLDDNLRELFKLDEQAADAVILGIDPNPFIDTPEEQALGIALATTYASLNPFTPVDGVIDAGLDEYRYDIEIQDTFIYSPTLTLVSGASFRRDLAKSSMYFNGDIENDTSRLFASATWQATENSNVHFGLMAEKESDADLVIAPRAALNYKLTPSQSLRFVFSESVRSPDLMEQDANWQLKLEASGAQPATGSTYYKTQQGPGNLDHQFIRSYEIGYYGRYAHLDGELDIRLFHEDLTDVYFQDLDINGITTIADVDLQFSGVEWQFSFEPWHDGQLRWSGAYVDAHTNVNDVSMDAAGKQMLLKVYAKNSHAFAWLQTWSENTLSSASFHLIDSYDEFNDDPDMRSKIHRIDGKLIHTIVMPRVSVDLTLNIQHDLLDDPYIWQDTIYESQTRVQLAARVNF